MNELILKDSRSLSLHMGETVYVGDNRITKLTVTLPDTIGGYPRAECQIELRAYIGREEFLSYSVVSADAQTELRLENDLTDAARNVELTMIITHNGNVIGRTNTVTLTVTKAKDGGEELTPRGQFDAVITAQRETIAQQAATIAEQSGQISDDAQTISGLNTQIDDLEAQHAQTVSGLNAQISELEDEIDELEDQHATDLAAIQALTESTPPLETPNPVTPSSGTQIIRPSSGYVGLASVTVNGIPAADPTLQQFLSKSITTLAIDGDIIDDYLCYKQTGLTSVTFNGNPTAIGNSAFNGCSALPGITLPNSVRQINNNAFYGCNHLTNITLPSGLIRIGQNAFYQCIRLQSLNIPRSVSNIEPYAFAGCWALQTLTIPGTLSTIGSNNFQGCSGLQTVTLESGVTTINSYAFQGCPNLSQITIPESVATIRDYVFRDCTSLVSITLPSRVTRLEGYLFENCYALQSVSFGNVTSFGNCVFNRCQSLRSITLPRTLTSIGNNCFSGCTALENVTLESGFNANGLNLASAYPSYPVATMVSWLDALADRSGQSAYTLTIGASNKSRLTAEQIAVATAKNWNLA